VSWFLFMDESGHDHKKTPYEVRGGVALHADRVWPFIRQMQDKEKAIFGDELITYGKELKGERLLNRPRYHTATKKLPLEERERRNLCSSLLRRGGKNPKGDELIAYAQACISFVHALFQILKDNDAVIFASAIPKGVKKPSREQADFVRESYLRKDLVYLFERYYYLMEQDNETGAIVMDQSDEHEDKRMLRRIHEYFTRTGKGQRRSSRIIPAPFFVSSELAYPIQAADICIYCINWGFRLPLRGMNNEHRQEIADDFGGWLAKLQYRETRNFDGEQCSVYGIVHVTDPYSGKLREGE